MSTSSEPYVTLPIDTTDDPEEIAATVAAMAACSAAFDIVTGNRRIRYRPEEDLLADALGLAAVRDAYPDHPSVPHLLSEARLMYHHRMVDDLADRRHPGIVDPARKHDHQAQQLLLEAVVLDIVALQCGADIHSPTECARLSNQLRKLRHLPVLDPFEAQKWLRAAYADWLRNGPHRLDCPGGCNGSGQILAVMVWQEDDLVPLHVEPVDCRRGAPEPGHDANCICRGSGFTHEPGERHLCLGPAPENRPGPITPQDHGKHAPDHAPW
ncbi:hypothetical protein ACIRST_38915 [Kitasatospora sp. NPDC101447]|uniref:hypothetical protein n=1 Tax=Kitasatospora sp. NPDC101447 TaxID=3364102 RepID=UPI0037F264A1